ncbi:MAG: baseplate J/gp47 family protein [Oligoflexales bacterium]
MDYLAGKIEKENITSGIDLSRLPAPKAIEDVSYEDILEQMKSTFLKKMKAIEPAYELYESDPAMKILEVAARREVGLRAKINDAIRDCMLAYADGSNLDQIAALFQVERKVFTQLDTLTGKALKESDASLRNRALLSFERFSTAGAEAAYVYQAKKVGAKLDLFDVKAYTKQAGHVYVTLLYKDHSKRTDKETKKLKRDIIAEHLNRDDIKPLTDILHVEDAELVDFEPKATLYVASSSAALDIVKEKAIESLKKFAAQSYRVGADISLSSLYAALSVPNVWDVTLKGMSENHIINNSQVARLIIKDENFSVEVKER